MAELGCDFFTQGIGEFTPLVVHDESTEEVLSPRQIVEAARLQLGVFLYAQHTDPEALFAAGTFDTEVKLGLAEGSVPAKISRTAHIDDNEWPRYEYALVAIQPEGEVSLFDTALLAKQQEELRGLQPQSPQHKKLSEQVQSQLSYLQYMTKHIEGLEGAVAAFLPKHAETD